MNQTQISIDGPLLREVLSVISSNTPDDWNRRFRTREFQAVMQQKGADALRMDFTYQQRRMFYQCINSHFVKNAPVDYLEFGVAKGGTLMSWMFLNKNPTSRFFGFDSFQGLPEFWHDDAPKGAYSTHGQVPAVDDPRARFVVGLFQDTVDAFSRSFAPRNRLVLHMDADLYSSTLYCLMHMDRHIRPGTIILFDEFTANDCTDEFAALQDYCRACYRDYKFIACRNDNVKLAIEITK